MDALRAKKVADIRKRGMQPYAALFDRTHTLAAAKDAKDGAKVKVAGRVMLFRDMGKMTFGTLQDHTGRVQIAWKEDVIGAAVYKDALELIDLGDFIGIEGERFTTQKGEPTIMANSWIMLTKAVAQPPEKWHGIADQETAWRQRYLDLMSNRETMERFEFRSNFVRKMREFYWKNDFMEMETPVLVNAASGALATPFKTHHKAYDIDVYLRIATETFLKECLVGGFDRVFEVGRIFRNEGLDPSHLQDFTMVEHYAAYWDYVKNMDFTEEMLQWITKELLGTTKVKIPDRDGNLVEVDFKPPWPRLTLREAIKNACKIDIDDHPTAESLRSAMTKANVKLDVPVETLGRGNLIDQLYKKVSRPSIIQPTFIMQHPLDLSPLARRNDKNPDITDRFQLVVGGWEIVNAYSELVDPIDQAERFDAQAKANAGGDSDAHRKDDEYIAALEYGCPPCSGWGMGIDRIVALLTQQSNLRDVVLFPLMKPEKSQEKKPIAATKKDRPAPTEVTGALPDEKSKRFIVVLNGKIEPGKLMNALGHMTAGLAGAEVAPGDMHLLEYQNADGDVQARASHFPFIVLKADNSNQLRTLRQEAAAKGIPHNAFTSSMTQGTSQEQRDATKSTPEKDLEYFGVSLFGNTEELRALTKKFSLFR